ncbi:MAG: 3'-5' exonuclease domain-containing protein 2 [Cyclobacteriaceae bacterium]|nr:3'-5' exonuclease domain-containing protein 2 [Cyclobacteriaceae bacterium]
MPPKHNLSVTISNEEINELPLGAFEGKVLVISEEKLLSRVFDEVREHKVVGFDTETKPVFVRGQQNKVSLIQIALPDKVFLVRVKYTGMHASIIKFLESNDIRKAGVALRDDIKAMQRLKQYEPNGFIELAELSKQAGLQVESVKKLTALLLGFRISKSAQTSNWEADVLNEKQISYAATDAWVCLEIYHKLQGLLN